MSTSTVQGIEPRSLECHGIQNVNTVYWNLSTPRLYEEALRRHEGRLGHLGPFVVRTGQYTGRSPRDKFIVREGSRADQVWWGDVNRPMEPAQFETLRRRLLAYLQDRDLPSRAAASSWLGALMPPPATNGLNSSSHSALPSASNCSCKFFHARETMFDAHARS